MTLLVFGVDPGIGGAVSVILDGVPVRVFDMPTRTRNATGTAQEIASPVLAQLVRDDILIHPKTPTIAVFERVNAQPKRDFGKQCPVCRQVPMMGIGVSGAFHYGENAASARTVFEVLGVPIHMVSPQTWKKFFGLKGGKENKGASRTMAMQLYPSMAKYLARASDDGRAEALLIARWGYAYHASKGTPIPDCVARADTIPDDPFDLKAREGAGAGT